MCCSSFRRGLECGGASILVLVLSVEEFECVRGNRGVRGGKDLQMYAKPRQTLNPMEQSGRLEGTLNPKPYESLWRELFRGPRQTLSRAPLFQPTKGYLYRGI